MPEFQRKRNRLPEAAYRGRRAYFVTICTRARRSLFTDAKLVALLLGILREKCTAQGFEVHAYCFMPDHLHLALIARADSCQLAAMMKVLKGATTSAARQAGVRSLWQKGFYDHVIRTDASLGAIAWYIFNNPVRKGFAARISEWPFSGSLVFDWKKMALAAEPFTPPWKKTEAGL